MCSEHCIPVLRDNSVQHIPDICVAPCVELRHPLLFLFWFLCFQFVTEDSEERRVRVSYSRWFTAVKSEVNTYVSSTCINFLMQSRCNVPNVKENVNAERIPNVKENINAESGKNTKVPISIPMPRIFMVKLTQLKPQETAAVQNNKT